MEELAWWFPFKVEGVRTDSEQAKKGQQGPKSNARKGGITERLQSPQKGFSVFSALVISSVVIHAITFIAKIVKNSSRSRVYVSEYSHTLRAAWNGEERQNCP